MTQTAILTNDALAVLNASRSMPLMAVLSVKFAASVTLWVTRSHSRRALQQLEPWQLRDVGLTPEAARTEARKVFWQA
jgi:uncharacterized protein YjiS (DUF1127 family)